MTFSLDAIEHIRNNNLQSESEQMAMFAFTTLFSLALAGFATTIIARGLARAEHVGVTSRTSGEIMFRI